MNLPDGYTRVLAGEVIESTLLIAYLPATSGFPAAPAVVDQLRDALDVVAVVDRPPTDDARWQVTIEVLNPQTHDSVDVQLQLAPARELDEHHLEWDGFTAEEKSEARASQWSIAAIAELGDEPLADYHLVLGVVAAAAPSAVAVLDVCAHRAHPGTWVRAAGSSRVPPPPTSLYAIHIVHPDNGDDGRAWLHTHGLLRCGCLELEALDVPVRRARPVGELLNAIASMFLDHGVPPCDEPFDVGRDLEMVWLPWERAIARLARGALGASDDRDGDSHSQPSAALFVPSRGILRRRYLDLSNCVPTLERNPVFYVSKMETDRRRLLAEERLDEFRGLCLEHCGDDDWQFAVKLGYETGVGGAGMEHLWFSVQGVSGDDVDATLLNEPYYVADLQEGDRGPHSLDRLSDWMIYSPYGNHGPDGIHYLIEKLAE